MLNAANSSVAGTTTGVPTAISVNLGALESSNALSGQAAQAAEAAVAAAANRGQQTAPQTAASIIDVKVFIGCDPDNPEAGSVCQGQ